MKKVLILIIYLISSSIFAEIPIDLTTESLYVREGFEKKWINSIPAKNIKWLMIKGNKGNRSVKVRTLGLKGVPRFSYFNLKRHKTMNFTFVTSFTVNNKDLTMGPLGIFLAQVGCNWEVYCNGKLLAREIYPQREGRLTIERAVRNEIIPIKYNVLKKGKNILAFRIVGDPLDDRTGFFMKAPYYINTIKSMTHKRINILSIMFIGIYIFFGLYHIFLFLIRPVEKFNLFYGILAISSSFFFLMREPIVFEVFTDTYILKHIEMVSLFLLVPSILGLTDFMIRNRMTLFSKILSGISLICVAVNLMGIRETPLRIMQLSTIFILLYVIIYNLLIPIVKEINKRFMQYTVTDNKSILLSIFWAFTKSIFNTIPGNLIIGLSIVFITTIVDIVTLTYGNPTSIAQYGFFAFVIGISGVLANRFNRVHKKMEELNVTLEHKVEERTEELQATMEELVAINDELTNTKDALWGEMILAKKIQTVLLPGNPQMDGYEISAYMAPADEVGGDYYDVINAGGKDWVVIGDVSGHGVPAGLIMMMVQTSIHLALNQSDSLQPSELLSVVNKTVTENIRRLNEDKYMTINVLACLEEGKFIHAGLHQDIMIYRKKESMVDLIETDGMWIGLMDDISGMVDDKSFELHPGDVMVLYTDGITEAWATGTVKNFRDPETDMYGDEYLKSLINDCGKSSADEIKINILDSLKNYETTDDVTILVIKRNEVL